MSKTKQPQPDQTEILDWTDSVQQHPAFQWMLDNRKHLPSAFLILLAVIIIGYKLTSGRASQAESNYLLAENYFSQIQQSDEGLAGAEKRKEALTELQSITNSYPELQSRYDGVISQLLLAQEEVEAAKPYTKRTLKRTSKDQAPHYEEFSKITLLISEKKFDKALSQSLKFKETLSNVANADLLYTYTLLRIAMLYKEMGLRNEEIQAWDEWAHYTSGASNTVDPQTLEVINALFTEGDFNLNHYISGRKKILNNASST